MRRMSFLSMIFLCALILSTGSGCTEDEAAAGFTVAEGEGDKTKYGDDTTSVVTSGAANDETLVVSGDPGEECVDVEGECVDISDAKGQYCDDPDAQADVIVVDGEVVEVICYPPADDGTPIEEVERDADGNAEVPQTENGSVIIFSEDTNGEPIVGDLKLEAERTTLYGNGVDETIIDGNLIVASNNSRVRGVTITKNVTFDTNSNGSKITFCKIEGNLDVKSNDVSVVNCQIFGNVKVSGNGATLVNVGVQGDWDIDPSAFCDGCYSFSDENDDLVVQDGEIGDPLTCGGGTNNGGTNNGGPPTGTNNGLPGGM